MRLSKTEVERRHQAVLTFFRNNPTVSVAKMNAALKAGEITGKPEKMLNIATGYKWRKEAVHDAAMTAYTDVQTAVSPEAIDEVVSALPPDGEVVKVSETFNEETGEGTATYKRVPASEQVVEPEYEVVETKLV